MTSQPLVIDDDDRYSRLRLIAWWDQEKLRRARVLVVGAGALGNEVLKNLALLGVGRIYIVDFDRIENSNLTRSVLFRACDRGREKATVAAEAAREINPDCTIIPRYANIITDIGLGLFREVDVVIGCLDNREARLWVNRQCWKVGTPWVDGGIQEISGVVKVFTPPNSACYECAMTENDYKLINLRYSCPLLSREDLLAGRVPTAPTIASMIGGLQTQEALKLIHGLPVEAGSALVFNGAANKFYTTQLPFREDCLSHETYPSPIELSLSAATATAEDLFRAAQDSFSSNELTLELDCDLVVSIACPKCERNREIMRPQQAVGMSQARCECGEQAVPHMVNRIARGDDLARETLAQLGIPPYDVVRVSSGKETHPFLLGGDRAAALE